MRTDHVSKICEACRFALAAKKRPTKLLFEKLDGARQRRLGHIALLARAREIEFLGHREEITNLVHFHDNLARRSKCHWSLPSGIDGSYRNGRSREHLSRCSF